MENMSPVAKPKYRPIWMALSNIIIFGAAYLVLHLYARFFIVYGLVFIYSLINIFAPNLLVIKFLGYLDVGLGLFVLIDTYIQTKKIVEGQIALPIKKKGLTILGVLSIIALFSLFIGARIFATGNSSRMPGENSFLQEMQLSRDKDTRIKEILAQYPQKSDVKCESFRNDPSLYNGQYIAKNCYLKKALESNDPSYCVDFGVGKGYNGDCISALAIKNKKPELCFKMLAEPSTSNCQSAYQRGNLYINDPCGGSLTSENMKLRCKEIFGDYFNNLYIK